MPQKDPEKYKAYKREQMRQRRAQAKKDKKAGGNLQPLADDVEVASTDVEVSVKTFAPAPPSKKVTSTALPSALVQAEDVAARTRLLLDTRGWCIWKCDKLGGDKVVILRDETVTGWPDGLPVYLESELEKVGDMTPWALRQVHEAMKLAQARLL